MPTRRASPRPAPPPEAALIAAHRIAISPRLSRRRAAALAGIAAQSWANVESGRKVVTAGVVLPWRGSADMVARMAAVVGVTPEELEQAGREDAAEILVILLNARRSTRAKDAIAAAAQAVAGAAGLTPRQRARLVKLIEAAVDEDEKPLSG